MKHRRAERGAVEERPLAGPVVAVLERHGRFLTATAFFERGRRMNVDRPRAGSAARPGDLVLVAPTGPARRSRQDPAADRQPGRRPRRDRGDAAGPRAAAALRAARGARGARGGRAAARGGGGGAAGPARAADLHDRPADRARLRRRDLRRGARRRRRARLGPHRRRLALRQAGVGGRPRGVPARHQRLRAGEGRADAARGAVQRRLLAGPAPRPARGHRRAGVRGREGPALGVPPLDHPLRRAARLPARGPRLRRRGAGAGAVGGAAGRGPAGRRRAPGGARGARGARRRVRGARVRVRARGPRHRAGVERADRVAPADRAPDDRRQRGRGDAARDAEAAGALPGARAARAGAGGAPGRPAGVARRPDARRCRTR